MIAHITPSFAKICLPPTLLNVLSFLLVLPTVAYPSAAQITGRVTDARTGEPLAFVHILIENTQTGTMTDIDGFFTINIPDGHSSLRASFVGYHPATHTIDPTARVQNIRMHRQPFQLPEVTVLAGENPAHRIIRNAIANRRRNNPENLRSFTYNSYNKFVATLDQEYFIQRWELIRDSASLRTAQTLDTRHIFMMESVAERKFLSPNFSNETVIANRVSGLQNPTFTLLATELQPFSFYEPTIALISNSYISPLNSTAFSRYSYHLRDTIPMDNDSVFVIEFRPRPGTSFNGLKGLLYIHTHQWAIQNVIAEPASKPDNRLQFRIQQMYELVDGKYWFPVQLNTDIDFAGAQLNSPQPGRPIRMLGRSYIRDIAINPPLRPRQFSNFNVDFTPDANLASDHFWISQRPQQLTMRELNTYTFMDSVGQARNLDRLLNSTEHILSGELPLGRVSVPFNSLYRFNQFERHRIGLGLVTNSRFSRKLHLGGGYAWGTGDKREKYHGFAEVLLWKQKDLRLGVAYHNDVNERGGTRIAARSFLLSPNMVRNLYMDKMDYTEITSVYSSINTFRNFLQTSLTASQGNTFWTDLYYYQPQPGEPAIRKYSFNELSLGFRFAWGETLINTPLRVWRIPSDYPVFHLNVTAGEADFNTAGVKQYLRAESRTDFNYKIPFLGRQTWLLEAGYTYPENLPWPLLFTAKAGDKRSFIAAPLSFGTMGMSEFAASKYAAVFFQHSFQGLLFRTPSWQPELVLISNAGLGKLSHPENHIYLKPGSWHRGFFESGIAINKLLPRGQSRLPLVASSPGIEVLYRYGPYALPNVWDNITVKMSIVTTF